MITKPHSTLLALAAFAISARGSAATGQASPTRRDLLPHALDGDRSAAFVRRQETKSDRRLDEDISFDFAGSRRVAVVTANGDSSVQPSNGGGPLTQTLDIGRFGAVVRRHEIQGKRIAELAAEVAANGDNLVQHPNEMGRSASMVRRREDQGKSLAADGNYPIQSRNERDSLAYLLDAEHHPAVVRRHETQGEHSAVAKEPSDLMRSRRVAIVYTINDSSIAADNAMRVAEANRLSTIPLSARTESPESVSVRRANTSSSLETLNGLLVSPQTLSPREDTTGQSSRRGETRLSFPMQRALLRDRFSGLPHSDGQYEEHEGISVLEAGLNIMSPANKLAQSLVKLTPDATPEMASAIFASGLEKTNVPAEGLVRGTALTEAQTSAIQQPVTTAAPAGVALTTLPLSSVTTAALAVAAVTTLPPSSAESTNQEAYTVWSLMQSVCIMLAIVLCCISVDFARSWAGNSSETDIGVRPTNRRTSSEYRSRRPISSEDNKADQARSYSRGRTGVSHVLPSSTTVGDKCTQSSPLMRLTPPHLDARHKAPHVHSDDQDATPKSPRQGRVSRYDKNHRSDPKIVL